MENCELKKNYCNNEDVKMIRIKSDHNVFDGVLKYACTECRKEMNGQFKLINNIPMAEKPKVDVAEIMKRANEKKDVVKASTEKIAGQAKSFKIVTGFSKYEFNGIILRNASTKAIIKFKTGRNKYQIKDDKGESHNLSNDYLKKLLPEKKAEAKKVKEPKAPRVKKEKNENSKIKNHHIPNPLPLDQLKPSARKIMESDHNNYDKVIELFEHGYSKEEIIIITGRRNDVISKYLRPLLKGKK